MKPVLAIVKCHVLFISFLRKEKGEYSELVLAAIQFPQEILAFFEEHATACSKRKSSGDKKATALLLISNGPLGGWKRVVFSCGNIAFLGKVN